MTDYIYMPIDLVEISKAEYYEARKDARFVKFNKPHGFLFSRGAKRVVYLTQNGKFYCGPLEEDRYEGDLDTFNFMGVRTTIQGIYKRKPSAPTVVAKATVGMAVLLGMLMFSSIHAQAGVCTTHCTSDGRYCATHCTP